MLVCRYRHRSSSIVRVPDKTQACTLSMQASRLACTLRVQASTLRVQASRHADISKKYHVLTQAISLIRQQAATQLPVRGALGAAKLYTPTHTYLVAVPPQYGALPADVRRRYGAGKPAVSYGDSTTQLYL